MTFKITLTDVILCNRALSMLPAQPITTLADDSTEADACSRWYKQTVAWLLELHHWNLAVNKSNLTATANARPAQWRYAYTKPADAAYVIGLTTQGNPTGFRPSQRTTEQGADFEVIGSVIYANFSALAAEHTTYNVTEAEFTEEFAGVIVAALAARIAMPVTKSADRAKEYQAQAQAALNAALAKAESENWPSYGTATETLRILCNRALSLVPRELDPNRDGLKAMGRMARTWYKATVGWLLEKHHWNLSTVRQPLVAIESERTQWAYAYTRPADCAFLARVTDGVSWWSWNSTLRGTRMFEAVGQTIYTNVPVAYADYTSYDVDEETFDEQFCDVIVTYLAARFAPMLTKNIRIAEQFRADAQQSLLMALARDLNASPQFYGTNPTESEIIRQVGVVGQTWPGDPTMPGTDFDGYADPIGLTIVPDESPPGQYYYEG